VSASVSSIRVIPAGGAAIRSVGRYRYIAMLAEGGMADVYLAVTQNAGFEKLVVIKQLRDTLMADPTFVAMFMDEARLAARLNHPNVVQTLEVGTDQTTGLHFLAMEFLEGVAYVRFARLKERIPSPAAFHVRILIDVLRGLHYAHELRDFDGKPLNVVHRDVSPQNVMLNFAGGVKILDFGIAKAALAAEQRPEDFKGKLEYMAPEQARRMDVDRRADIFSVGVMLHEALTKRRLYRKGEDKLGLLLGGQLPSVLDIAPTAPKRLATICAKAMAPDREQRYPTADAMADDLEDWLGSTTGHVSARDVGQCVSEKFAATRQKIGAAIEAQLALFRASAASDVPPDTIPISRLPVTDVPPDMPDPGPAFSVPPAHTPSIQMQAARPSGAIPAVYPSPLNAISSPPPTGARKRSGVVVATLGLLAFGVGGGVVGFVSHARIKGLTNALTETTATPAVSSARPAAAEDTQIDFTIKAGPPEARILLDNQPLGSNPANGKHPRDGAIHVVKIEAPGYEPREESLSFERSLLVTIELRPVPPPPVESSKPSGRTRLGSAPRGGRQ
jgi:serine/threonine-protein kinase